MESRGDDIPEGQLVAHGLCPCCRHELAADEESIYCPYCGWRPTELADWYDCPGFPHLAGEEDE